MLRKYKFTMIFTLLFAVACGFIFADSGRAAWWYAAACCVLIVFMFLGEVGR